MFNLRNSILKQFYESNLSTQILNKFNVTNSMAGLQIFREKGNIVGVTWYQRSHNRRGRGFRKRVPVTANIWHRSEKSRKEVDLTKEAKNFSRSLSSEQYSQISIENSTKSSTDLFSVNNPKTCRTGVLAIKLGTVTQWTKSGRRMPLTLLQVLDNHVINYVPPEVYCESHNYSRFWYSPVTKEPLFGMAVVGALSADPTTFHPRYLELFKQSGVAPKRRLTRFLVSPEAKIDPGTPLRANHFRVGDYVDCQARTIFQGFQGVMKRWGMKGGPATHGVTKSHRRIGSVGGGRKRGIWKGKRMPGITGNMLRIKKAAKIWRINTKYNVLYIQGKIPGVVHAWVRVYDTTVAARRQMVYADNPPPMPTEYEKETEEDLLHPDLYSFDSPSITYENADTKN